MKAKLGMSPIAWWNDDLVELSDDVSLEECLRQSRSAGFTGMEKGRRFPDDPKVMLPILRKADVTLCGGWFSGTLVNEEIAANKDRIQPMIDLFKAVNAPCIVYGEVGRSIQGDRSKPLATKPKLTDDEMKAYARKVTEFGEWCAGQGMPLSYHHHMAAVVETEPELDAFMAASGPGIPLLLDAGHLAFAGGDVLRAIDNHHARINHVHVKDVRMDVIRELDRSRQSFLDAVALGAFTVPGDGSLDFGAIVQKFAGYGYEGWFVVEAEQDPKKNPPLRMAQVGYKELMRVMTAAGYTCRDTGVPELMPNFRLKRPADGHITVTPRSAGWTYVGFEVDAIEAGHSAHDNTGDRELCLVFVSGKGRVSVGGKDFGELGKRMSPFDGPPAAVYVPPHTDWRVTATTQLTLAGCSAPGGGDYPARVIDVPPQITRGKGSNTRYVTNILPETDPAHSLLVVEVITPGGNTSSYPPHKHDTDDLPNESLLEETYYHRLNPPQGFAMQRVYTDDRSLDEALVIEDGDVTLVPRGYHPVAAVHGYDLYYLNVMAGPKRTWKFHNAAEHEWLMK